VQLRSVAAAENVPARLGMMGPVMLGRRGAGANDTEEAGTRRKTRAGRLSQGIEFSIPTKPADGADH